MSSAGGGDSLQMDDVMRLRGLLRLVALDSASEWLIFPLSCINPSKTSGSSSSKTPLNPGTRSLLKRALLGVPALDYSANFLPEVSLTPGAGWRLIGIELHLM